MLLQENGELFVHHNAYACGKLWPWRLQCCWEIPGETRGPCYVAWTWTCIACLSFLGTCFVKRQPVLQRCISFLRYHFKILNPTKMAKLLEALLPRTRFSRTVCRTPASQRLQRFTCIDEIQTGEIRTCIHTCPHTHKCMICIHGIHAMQCNAMQCNATQTNMIRHHTYLDTYILA